MKTKCADSFSSLKSSWNGQARKPCAYDGTRLDGMRCVADERGWAQLDADRDVDAFASFHQGDHEIALDFGCGVGRLVPQMLQRFDRVICVDISPVTLSSVEQYITGKGCDVNAIELCEFPGEDNLIDVPDESVDLVYSCMCMQHISDKQARREIYDELVRVIKHDGTVALQFHVGDDGKEPNWKLASPDVINEEFEGTALIVNEVSGIVNMGDRHGDWVFVGCKKRPS